MVIEESKRVKKFRREIINMIPKFPNDRATKEALEAMSLATLLIHYFNWQLRFIADKPRTVVIEPAVTSDPRWKRLKPNIDALLEKVRSGAVLTPHLSLLASTNGYTPASANRGPDTDRWADKDLILNAMGYHHLHLSLEVEKKGHVGRDNEILFAQVSRTNFTAIGLFDHSVFDTKKEEMTPERTRLWKIFDAHSNRGAPPGTIMIQTFLTMSGHPVNVVTAAMTHAQKIRATDQQLDDWGYVQALYADARLEIPKKLQLEWATNYSEIILRDKVLGCPVLRLPGAN